MKIFIFNCLQFSFVLLNFCYASIRKSYGLANKLLKELEINKDRKRIERQFLSETIFDDSEVDDDSYMQIMATTASNSASSNNLLWDVKQNLDCGSVYQNFESRSPSRTLSALSLLATDNGINSPNKIPFGSGSVSRPQTGFTNLNGLNPDVNPRSTMQVWLAVVVVVAVNFHPLLLFLASIYSVSDCNGNILTELLTETLKH